MQPWATARRRRNKKIKPEAAAEALRTVGMNLKGMALALDALQEVQVAQWRLLATEQEDQKQKHTQETAEETTTRKIEEARDDDDESDFSHMFSGDPGGCLEHVRGSACRAMRAAVAEGKSSEKGKEGAVIAAELRAGLQQLDGLLTEQRRRHYAPIDDDRFYASVRRLAFRRHFSSLSTL